MKNTNEEQTQKQVAGRKQHLVSTHEYGDPPTVAEVIEKLQNMPQHLRCYFRPKYHGSMTHVDEIPIHYKGISKMEPVGKPQQVTFLC